MRTMVAMVSIVFTTAFAGMHGSAVAAECDALHVPSLALHRCVVPGGQVEIDAGHVARVDGWSTTSVHWLAGHRTSHGGTFGDLPAVSMGDLVSFRGREYVIVDYTTVRYDDPAASALFVDWSTPTVVLQTSRDSSSAHLWRAEAASPAPSPVPRVPEPFELVVDVPGFDGDGAVVLNVTATNAAGFGYITAYGCGSSRPITSNVNYAPNEVESNLVIVHPGDDGRICLYSSEAADIIVDEFGVFPTNGTHTPTSPTRLTDTRNRTPRTAGSVLVVDVPGFDGDGAVVLNVTATNAAGFGYITAYGCGSSRPITSNVNYAPNEVESNLVIVHPGDDGRICLYSSEAADIIVDEFGVFPTNGTHTPTSPTRLTDTRND